SGDGAPRQPRVVRCVAQTLGDEGARGARAADHQDLHRPHLSFRPFCENAENRTTRGSSAGAERRGVQAVCWAVPRRDAMTRARQDRLLAMLVREDDWITAAVLADALGVTPRSIRSYVTALNARAPDGDAIESGPQGYRALPAAALLRAEGQSEGPTPRDRLHTVVRALLDADDGIDVFETADRLHVSPATLEADLARVRALLGGTELTLERSAAHARLRGTEVAQRRLLSRPAHD